MFEVYHIKTDEVVAFAMVLIRISAFVVTMPIIGGENVPARLKVLLSLVLALLTFPALGLDKDLSKNLEAAIFWVGLKEALTGVILGFVSRLFFFSLTVAGELVSISVGLSSEQLLNPTLGGRATALQQFQILLGSMFFLSINGHYYLISGIVKSFEIIPLSLNNLNVMTAQTVAKLCQDIVWDGLKLAAPVMAAVFFMNIVMGVLGRAVPQINVLVTSLPANTLVGFGVVFVSIPLWLGAMDSLTTETAATMFKFMKAM